jgi:CHAT domain-containing protein/tetratricopeptide (TPR) repeat protein
VGKDSAYALLLLKIGKYEFVVKHDYTASLTHNENALAVNNAAGKGKSQLLKINGYFNYAYYCEALMLYRQASIYFDSVIVLWGNQPDTSDFVIDSWRNKVYLSFITGDYQKAIDQSQLGLSLAKDSFYYVYFMNQTAQSLFLLGQLDEALTGGNLAAAIAERNGNWWELATSYKTVALIHERKTEFELANIFFKKAVEARKLTLNNDLIASDYNDWGNFFVNSLKQYSKAEQSYLKTIEYANRMDDSVQRSLKISMAFGNLGENYLDQGKVKQAETFFLKSFSAMGINIQNDIKLNPPSSAFNRIMNKDLVMAIMNDKTELLLQLYKTTNDKSFLSACIQTAFVTDSVITQLRHEQLAEQSKLYWRNKTREFFAAAIEACRLANNPKSAFYFFEKSRAVLLNDKLTELGASAQLPPDEAAAEEKLKTEIALMEQTLSQSPRGSTHFQQAQIQLLEKKNDFEKYIASLEQRYPAYYQYKYADNVHSLSEVKQYLAKNNQSFVHYFIGDTVSYILAITAQSTKFIRLAQKDFNREQLITFLQMCSDKEKLNSQYPAFAAMANSIYRAIFEKLQLPKGRVIICADNFLIPFDALCDDPSGRHFLLNDYSFSYVYSARYLMKQFNNSAAVGNFLGFAPVSFATYLQMPELKDAADALHASASYYKSDKLFTGQDATRSNFFNYASSYSVVSVFSHAIADTSGSEPKIFMHDSVIFCLTCRGLNNPAARLVLLSACQTNIGKNATGEGVYSLARGFSSAGIPSVVATMWSADEQMIYAITEKLNEYLSKGMSKDEALQKAKLYFIQNNGGEKLLPYYWANVVLIGNTDSINLATKQNNYWWWVAGIGLAVFVAAIIFLRKKRALKVI